MKSLDQTIDELRESALANMSSLGDEIRRLRAENTKLRAALIHLAYLKDAEFVAREALELLTDETPNVSRSTK